MKLADTRRDKTNIEVGFEKNRASKRNLSKKLFYWTIPIV